MKIAILSDLHLNFYSNPSLLLQNIAASSFDVLVVAGDLGTASSVLGHLQWLEDNHVPTLFVPGNHDYYHGSIGAVDDLLLKAKFSYVQVLQCSSTKIKDVTFAGCTLWFRSSVGHLCSPINDYSYIKNFSMDEPLENKKHLKFLNKTKSDIFITHHIPSSLLIDERYKDNPLNPYFVCDVAPKYPPKLWIYGHTHTFSDKAIGNNNSHFGVRYFCNPLGYPSESQNHIKFIEV